MEEMRNAQNIIAEESEGKKPFGRPWIRNRWKDNIKMDHREINTVCVDVD
jgi:hypothetical protein